MVVTTLLQTWRQPLVHLGSRCIKSLTAIGHGRRTTLLLRVLHESRANPFYNVGSNWHTTRASRLSTAATSNASNSSRILSKPAKCRYYLSRGLLALKGALPGELLNVAIMELQSWQCPAIFIPRNHNQVDASMQQSQEWEMNRSKRGAISESELSAAEATLMNTNTSFAQMYVLVSSTKTAWETLGEELEMALKNGVDSWSLPRKCPEKSKTGIYKGFEDLLQRQSQISHQVSSVGILRKHLSVLEKMR